MKNHATASIQPQCLASYIQARRSSQSRSLDVTSIGRATIAIAILRTRSSGGIGSVMLLLAPRAEPVLLGLLLSTQLDISRGGVAGQSIHATTGLGVVLLAAPPLTAGAVGVVVGGGRAEALLALVVAGKEDLEEDGDQEEEAGENRKSVLDRSE